MKELFHLCGRYSLLLTVTLEKNGDDKSVDTQDTSHDNWDDGLEEKFWLKDDCTADTDSRLGSSVGCAEVSEDQGSCDAHISEECILVAIVVEIFLSNHLCS